jgi:hypothetical protein
LSYYSLNDEEELEYGTLNEIIYLSEFGIIFLSIAKNTKLLGI